MIFEFDILGFPFLVSRWSATEERPAQKIRPWSPA